MITLIENATTTGIGEAVSVISGKDTGHDIHSIQASFTGSPSDLVISILGTIDGANYFCLAKHKLKSLELTTGNVIFHIKNKPVPKIKASIDILTGGVSPQVSIYYFKGSVSA